MIKGLELGKSKPCQQFPDYQIRLVFYCVIKGLSKRRVKSCQAKYSRLTSEAPSMTIGLVLPHPFFSGKAASSYRVVATATEPEPPHFGVAGGCLVRVTTTKRNRSRQESVIRTPRGIPTLAQMIRDSAVSLDRIKRATERALLEWFAQSERLNIAQQHHKLHGDRFVDFANRIGVDRASAYQLVKLWKWRTKILKRCRDEGRYYGWETCLYWYEKSPRTVGHHHTERQEVYGTPPAIFQRYGSTCTLDVAATPMSAKCAEYFTKAEDGLKRPWHGVVWLNPPYDNLYPWTRKALEYARAGGTVIALLPVWTDAPWFHEFVAYGKITFLRGKLSQVGRPGYAPYPSMIVEWNPTTVQWTRGEPLHVILDPISCHV